MPSVEPFVGLVYDRSIVGPIEAVTAPPYDVIDEPARARYLSSSPYSVAHLDLAKGPGGYDEAARDLKRWREERALREVGPSWFAYEMRTTTGEIVRGVICALALEGFGGGILPHEDVMEGPVRDRLRLLGAARVHPSAIYGTVERVDRRFAAALEDASSESALVEATDEEGIRHRMWALPPEIPLDRWLSEGPVLIADGHHRYSTALLFRERMREELGPAAGPWDRIPCLIADENEHAPVVLPYHRLVVAGTPRTTAMATAARSVGDLAELVAAIDDDEPSVGVVEADGSYFVLPLQAEPPAVLALHSTELRGTDAARLRYTPSASVAERAVRTGDAQIAYILPSTTPARIRAVLRRGKRLPQKSTFFWPKPRTGMVMMPVGEATDVRGVTPEADRAS